MRRVLDADAFASWFSAFLPGIERREPSTLFTPAIVSDRTDPYIVHLDGLNLSRAWCWRGGERAFERRPRRHRKRRVCGRSLACHFCSPCTDNVNFPSGFQLVFG